MKKTPNAKQLAYVDGLDLIPLHTHDSKRTMHGRTRDMGKAPLDAAWTTNRYDPAKVVDRSQKFRNNVGVRLSADMLVVDVDPKNGGKIGFANLCADLGLNFDDFPQVITGSGGRHIYCALPVGTLVLDTLQNEKYAGVEFKSKGRQVVAPGSIHPNGRMYKTDSERPQDFINLRDVPDDLLLMIKRPPRSVNTAGGGQIDNEQLTKMLNKLDAEDYPDNASWFPILCACHHATAGEGRQEFVDWATSDPEWADNGYEIGKRWDSLHKEKNNGYTVATLNRELRKHGGTAVQARNVVEDDDFPDDGNAPPSKPKKKKPKAETVDDDWLNEPAPKDDWLEGDAEDIPVVNTLPQATLDAIAEVNKNHIALIEGGRFRIVKQQFDHVEKRPQWISMDAHSFELMFANKKVEVDINGRSRNASPTQPLGKAWIESPDRRSVEAVVFDPEGKVGEGDGVLNLFNGFAYQPDPNGSWNYFRELMHDVIAGGDDEVDSWIYNWLAFMFQHPATLPGTAIVMIGDQGVGKGTFGNLLCQLVGEHAHAVGNSKRLTGQFNAHLRNLIFMFADEVTNPYSDKSGDTRASNILKNIITEEKIEIEKKGVDVFATRNHLHLVMATNDRWVIPAGVNERRYLVTEVSPAWLGNVDRFHKLHDELKLNNGAGFKRMMFDLMRHKIPKDWKPSLILQTKGLSEQKVMTLEPIPKFLHWFLDGKEGVRGINAEMLSTDDWQDKSFIVFKGDFLEAFEAWCQTMNIRPYSGARSVRSKFFREVLACFNSVTEMRKSVPDGRTDDPRLMVSGGLAPALRFPPINRAIEEFETTLRLSDGTIPRLINQRKDYGFG